MGVEIERKFLVVGEGWRGESFASHAIRQGYLDQNATMSVRVRVVDDKALLTLKSREPGVTRAEFEYAIPLADAEEMLARYCRQPLIEKVRHDVRWQGRIWSVDVFGGARAGLTLAEVELDEAGDVVAAPPWAGREVTHDPAYRNDAL